MMIWLSMHKEVKCILTREEEEEKTCTISDGKSDKCLMRIASYDLIEFQNLRKNIISGEYKTQNSIMFYLVKVD